ncbi:hypothetical protein AAFF_G00367030 [Aldrovandia affinis]|uniref:Uncharacterized protein n=1 Tax=Aldrovandia affinis TaxID=143900 RepID=A0AAD7SHF9_9TELE|nr:hypothetical protein AAFF_G00367030 [Aldrovandia affinis]
MSSTTQNITQNIQHEALDTMTPDNQNMTYISVESSIQQNSTRLDWILYTVPSSACLLGLFLFSLVLIKYRRREDRNLHKERCNKMKPKEHRLNRFSTENAAEYGDLCKVYPVETQSYENVEVAIYFNQEGVSYCVPAEDGDDYAIPNAEGSGTEEGREETQNDFDSLYPLQNLTDTDGESYENMEISLYAQPRRHTERDTDTQEEGDYIHPDRTDRGKETGKPCNHWCLPQNLTDTDGESYENMQSSEYSQPYSHTNPNRLHSPTAPQEEAEEEDDSYEKMASITEPEPKERETDWERGRGRVIGNWYHTQNTV